MRNLKAIISLKNLKSNYLYLKQLHGNKLLAVVKADAYGHGIYYCSKYLDNISDGFAVAFLEEAILLRDAGITNNILILEGVFTQQDYYLIEKHNLLVVIQNIQQLYWFYDHDWRSQVIVWLKLDTGMNRLGFDENEFIHIYKVLSQLKYVKQVVKMTHLCCADSPDEAVTNFQINKFNQTSNLLPIGAESIANSAGVLRFVNSYKTWGRVGISLYGVSPFYNNKILVNTSQLKPIMTLKSIIFSTKKVLKGESIGYGHTFTATDDMQIGIVACGYADGYPRLHGNNNPCLIDGIKSKVIGSISMDMLIVELNHSSQGIGSEVELWGEDICINEIAKNANTIAYELLCHVKRAYKEYVH